MYEALSNGPNWRIRCLVLLFFFVCCFFRAEDVGWLVGWSVGWSVGWLVGWLFYLKRVFVGLFSLPIVVG